MRLLLRISSMTVIFALLAGPGDPPNWLLGATLAAPLAFAVGGIRQAAPAQGFGVVFLPWFVLGIVLRTITGAAQTIRFLAFQRDWSKVGLMSCPSAAETERGRTLLALAETISPGGIAITVGDDLRLSAIDADAPEERCRKLRDWYARFQRPMAR